MWAASGQEVPDETPENIVSLEEDLRNGKLGVYAGMEAEVERLRQLSMVHISELSRMIDKRRAEIESLELEESAAHRKYFFLSLLGLIVAMCKDLPLWKDTRS